MSKPFKILEVIMGKTSCEYYRNILPAACCREELAKFNIEIISSYIGGADQQWLSSFDAYVISRIPPMEFYPIAYYLKSTKKKIILDIDDELWNIPEWNPAKKYYDGSLLTFLPLYLHLADVITVSTRNLADSLLKKYGFLKSEYVHVLENLMYCKDYEKFHNINKSHSDTPKKIIWSGSSSHVGDLQPLFDLVEYYADRKDILFMVFGYFPEEFARTHPNNVIHVPSCDKKHYEGILTSLSPHISLIPLLDDQFNRCKSAIKYYEMSLAGSASIASDVQPYSDVIEDSFNGFLCSNNKSYWISACDWNLRNSIGWKKVIDNSKANVLKNYSWDTDNPLRRDWINFFKSIPYM